MRTIGSRWLLAVWLVPALRIAFASSPATSDECPQIAPGPLSIQQVSAYFPPRASANFLDIESIRRTLAFYPLVIDGKDWDSLGNIFAETAVANYSDPIGVLNGLSAIKTGLQSGLAPFAGTQHLLGTQIIDICAPDTAISITYYTASHFFNGTFGASSITDDGQVIYAYGQYQDTWKQEDNAWKIIYRNLVYMGPLVSDIS